MSITPQILNATIFHARHAPREHSFSYKFSYLSLPLSKIAALKDLKNLSFNRFNMFSLYEKDHVEGNKSNFTSWIADVLLEHQAAFDLADIQLVTMPRRLGYVFNPISFWFCLDGQGQLRAVICEVRNTFGQKHCYLCRQEDWRIIGHDDWLSATKSFYVSPFFEVRGHYEFRFHLTDQKISIWINYFDQKTRLLTTSIIGRLETLTDEALKKSFWNDPLTTLKVICFIHFQALKLILKKIRLTKRPPPPESYISQ